MHLAKSGKFRYSSQSNILQCFELLYCQFMPLVCRKRQKCIDVDIMPRLVHDTELVESIIWDCSALRMHDTVASPLSSSHQFPLDLSPAGNQVGPEIDHCSVSRRLIHFGLNFKRESRPRVPP
eukprot:m.84605 g.84605  ORF g.84605 m.84605 type:complete len:123 (-) comp11320_c0_seq1:606-974(-)